MLVVGATAVTRHASKPGAYLASLYLGGRSLDVAAPALGAGLLLMVELGALSLELRGRVVVESGIILRRLALLAALALGCALLGYLLMLLAELPLPGGVALTAVGLIAATGVIGIIAALARR